MPRRMDRGVRASSRGGDAGARGPALHRRARRRRGAKNRRGRRADRVARPDFSGRPRPGGGGAKTARRPAVLGVLGAGARRVLCRHVRRGVPDRGAPTVFEVHPEVAFWRLNGNRPLDEPKKIKGVPYAPGLALRRALLVGAGFAPSCVEAVPPKGARPDDLLDALACAAIARCIYKGVAQPFPDPPGRDDYGLSIAIWA